MPSELQLVPGNASLAGGKRLCTLEATVEQGLKTLQELPSNTASSENIALSNFLILREIFRNLSYLTLLSCSSVNEMWKSTVASMIAHYRITITTVPIDGYKIEVDKTLGLREIPESSEPENIEALTGMIRSCSWKGSIYIELRVINDRKNSLLPEIEGYLHFLRDFGSRIHTFEYSSHHFTILLERYYHHLSYMPNIEVLKIINLKFDLRYSYNNTYTLMLYHLLKTEFEERVQFNESKALFAKAPNVRDIRIKSKTQSR